MGSARLNQTANQTNPQADDRHFGTVKEFGKLIQGKKTSYGWITDDRTGKDVFVHFTGIIRKGDEFRILRSGDRVQFRIVSENGRQKAVDVEVIG